MKIQFLNDPIVQRWQRGSGFMAMKPLMVVYVLILMPWVAQASEKGTEVTEVTEVREAPQGAQAKDSPPSMGMESESPPIKDKAPAAPSGASTPAGFVREREARFRQILQSKEGKKQDADLKVLADELIDYRELGRRSLGNRWNDQSPKDQDEYVRLLQALIESSYLREASKDPQFQVDYEEEEVDAERQTARVLTLARSGQIEIELEYRLMQRPGGEGWIAYDIAIDGVSMVANYRNSFGNIIRKDGFDGLLSRMRSRLEEVRDK